MTETELKLQDAEIQLSLAQLNNSDEAIIRSCINAFISLARSITFVMQSESGGGTPLSDWYHSEMKILSNSPLLRFFNERRVYTIHKGTVTLQPTYFAILGTQEAPDGSSILGPQHGLEWIFDNIKEADLPFTAPAVLMCTEYLALLQDLVTRWISERAR